MRGSPAARLCALSSLLVALSTLVDARHGPVPKKGLFERADDNDFGFHLSSEVSPELMLETCFIQARHNISAAIYKFSDEHVYETLRESIHLRKDLKVRLVVNKDTTSKDQDEWLRSLMSAGNDVEIKYWEKNGEEKFQKLHAKFTLCDDLAVMGSANWSENSCDGNNMELLVVHRMPAVGAQMRGAFETLWASNHATSIE